MTCIEVCTWRFRGNWELPSLNSCPRFLKATSIAVALKKALCCPQPVMLELSGWLVDHIRHPFNSFYTGFSFFWLTRASPWCTVSLPVDGDRPFVRFFPRPALLRIFPGSRLCHNCGGKCFPVFFASFRALPKVWSKCTLNSVQGNDWYFCEHTTRVLHKTTGWEGAAAREGMLECCFRIVEAAPGLCSEEKGEWRMV